MFFKKLVFKRELNSNLLFKLVFQTMRVSILRGFLCWAMLVIVPQAVLGQSGTDQNGLGPAVQPQTGGAILHTQGGVWINGYEARDSSAVFPGDLIETKPGSAANLTLDGSSILIQAESVGKLQTNLLELDHGSVSVGTSTGFRVKVNCLTTIPVLQEWTQYEVTDLNGSVQVAARKDDVNVDRGVVREAAHRKTTSETETARASTTVHETEQKSFDESEICGAPSRPLGAGTSLNTKWIAAGGAVAAGVLICVLLCGGSSKTPPISTSAP